MSGSTWTWIGGSINVDSPTDWSLTNGPGNGTGIPETGDIAINNGTLVGYGLISATLINNGTVEAPSNAVPTSSTSGELTITGALTGNGVIDIGPDAIVRVNGSIGSGQTVAFNSGTLETLILGAPAATNAFAITNFGTGDRIEFVNGIAITSATEPSSSSLAVNYTLSGASGSYSFPNVSFAPGTPQSFWIYGDSLNGFATVMPINTFAWGGGAGTNYGNGANWNQGGAVPGPLDSVGFSLASGGTISGSGAGYFIGFTQSGAWSLAPGTTLVATTAGFNVANNSGATSVTVGTGAAVSSGGNIIVGNGVATFGTLIVAGGGQLSETAITGLSGVAMLIGSGTGASGTVTVTGTGSRINLGQNALALAVRTGTMGSLTVSQGGSVSAATQNSSNYDSIGIGKLDNGYVTVTDPGSQISAAGIAYIAHNATGTLTVENSASFVLTPDPTGKAGLVIGSGSTVGVGGTGVAYVLTSGELISQGYVDVGLTGTSGQLVVNGGTVQVGTTLAVATGGTIQNGATETGSGTLTIGAGGTLELTGTAQTSGYGVNLGNSNIGSASTENAVATVSGTGALLETNGNGIEVGALGSAALTVSQGGSVVSGTPDSSQIDALAVGTQGSGTVTVTGANSRFSTNGAAYFGGAGDGSLIVENQGSVVFGIDGLGAGGLSVGGTGTNATGTLYMGGAGGALVTSGGGLFSQAGIVIGNAGGSGSFTVNSGGTVESAQSLLIGNTVTVTGGTTAISPAGTTTLASATPMTGSGTLTVGSDGLLRVDGTGLGDAPDLAVGAGFGSMGMVQVTGAGADLTTLGLMDVGESGTGDLSINNQATVQSGSNGAPGTAHGFDIAANVASSGDVTVTGSDSLLANTGAFVVGDGGLGSLNIRSGGTVITSPGTTGAVAVIANQASSAGSSVIVTGAGSSFQIAGTLLVGNYGAGALNISAGGTVTASSLDAGVQNNGTAEGTAQISLTGAGSDLAISGDATLADAGSASMSILNGATFAAANLTIGSQGSASGALLVSDTGSVLDIAGTLNVGTPLGVGELTIGPNGTVIASKVVLNGEVVNEGGLLDPNEIDITANPIVGYGTEGGVGDIIVNDLSIEAKAGSKASQKVETVIGTVVGTYGTLSGTGYLVIDAGSTLDLQGGPVDSSQTVTFGANTGALVVEDIGGFTATIGSFQAGDTIFVHTAGTATFSQSGSAVDVISGGATLGVLDFASAGLAATAIGTGGALMDVPCFAAGTRIRTVRGEVRVEELRAGDVAITAIDGSLAPVVWIGHREVDCARHPDPRSVWPVRIRAGAFGRGLPKRALTLSPDHAVYVNAVLVPVKHLINGTTIAQVKADRVTYYHVELDRHDVVYADGLPAESYLDVGDRANFANGGAVVRLHIDLAHHWEAGGGAPLVVWGEELEGVKAVVAARASVAAKRAPTSSDSRFDVGAPLDRDKSAYGITKFCAANG